MLQLADYFVPIRETASHYHTVRRMDYPAEIVTLSKGVLARLSLKEPSLGIQPDFCFRPNNSASIAVLNILQSCNPILREQNLCQGVRGAKACFERWCD